MAFAITKLSDVDPNLVAVPVSGNAATGGPKDATASETDLAVAANTTTNSAIKDIGFALNNFRAVVYLKTLVGSSTLQVKLQVSNHASFTDTVLTVDTKFLNAVVATDNTANFTLFGQSPLIAGYRYMRIQFVTGSGTSGTADIIYYAA